MMELMMKIAQEDDRIRAFTMEGSQVNSASVRDKYSDFDICYVVRDIRDFTCDKKWIQCFGEILIVQCPDDWYDHPYDYEGHEKFTYLIQFADGNRIDLTLIDVRKIETQLYVHEPRTVLINKDNFKELISIEDSHIFDIQKPSEQEYSDTCNEFRWVSLYISKGLCRKEFYYARHTFEHICIPMLIRMLDWKIGFRHAFQVSTGSYHKYLKQFLSEKEMERFQGIFPGGDFEDMWEKLFLMQDYFEELAREIAGYAGFFYDAKEGSRIREFQLRRREEWNTIS